MIQLIPTLISLATGYLAVRLLLRKDPPPLALLAFLAMATGIGISSAVVFSSLVIFGQLVKWYVIGIHFLAINILTTLLTKTTPKGQRIPLGQIKRSDIISGLILLAFLIPVVLHAWVYPQGGWDAWSCWNLKARFIALGGDQWGHMFDPLLWRSNIAYPLLLPAFNAWSWCFMPDAPWSAPLVNSCLITFTTAGLLLFAIKKYAGRLHAALAPAWMLSILFVVKLVSSQYSDLLVGMYLLLTCVAFLCFQRTRDRGWLAVSAIAIGLMAFTKSEGQALAAIATVALLIARLCLDRHKSDLRKDLTTFLIALGIAGLPLIIFKLFYAPESHTFINGLISSDKPTDLLRLKTIGAFYLVELLSAKWNGFWLIALGGIVLSGRKAWQGELWFIPAIIGLYLLTLMGVYWINTFFETMWWISSTLNRILLALIPTIILWVFLAQEQSRDKG